MAKIKQKLIGECRSCANHYGEYNGAATRQGEEKRFILCRCILSPYSKLMSGTCKDYIKQTE